MYVDEDGEFFFAAIAIGAFIGASMGTIQAHMNGDPWYQGALKGALVGGVGGAMGGGAAILGQSLGVSGILTGAAYGAATGAVTGSVTGGLNVALYEKNIAEGMKNGAITGGITGGVMGAACGGYTAYKNGDNMWWGTEIGDNRTEWSFFNWDKADELSFGMPKLKERLTNGCVLGSTESFSLKSGKNYYKRLAMMEMNYSSKVGITNKNWIKYMLNKNYEISNSLSLKQLTQINPKNAGVSVWLHYDYYPRESQLFHNIPLERVEYIASKNYYRLCCMDPNTGNVLHFDATQKMINDGLLHLYRVRW